MEQECYSIMNMYRGEAAKLITSSILLIRSFDAFIFFSLFWYFSKIIVITHHLIVIIIIIITIITIITIIINDDK